MAKFEYKSINLSVHGWTLGDHNVLLEDMGNGGWELTSILNPGFQAISGSPPFTDQVSYVFKRQKEEWGE